MPRRKKPTPADHDIEKLILKGIYPTLDTDLARDNLENNLPAADLQDLYITYKDR